jgi:oxygen-independent coproporphyrinogen-3 oxidase
MAGVYTAYPFCGQKCTFCNFASGVFGQDTVRRYVSALLQEIRDWRWSWVPETVYLGGGTPSLMDGADLKAVLAAIPGRPWKEATLEAAPGTITEERASLWAECGVNRVSLGVQSFIAEELRRTGRRHTAAIVREEVERLRRVGIDNFNIDLIAGLPGQTTAGWEESLARIGELEAPHVSVYMLEVDEDSRLGREMLRGGARYGAADAPDEDLTVELYERAVERLAEWGIERYEISNFARKGRESRHNLKYWRLEEYVGFGADAHSFIGGLRWGNADSMEGYLAGERTEPEPARIGEERYWVGMRMMEGVELRADAPREAIVRLEEQGLVEVADGKVRLTRRGVAVSNSVFAEFVGCEKGKE